MRSITREESKAIDRRALEELGLPGIVLMENAGRGAAEALLEEYGGDCKEALEVLVLAGSGGNGGDGYVLARHLVIAGVSPHVVSLVPLDELVGDARTMLCAARGFGIDVVEAVRLEELMRVLSGLGHGAVLVDAVFGVGFRPPLRGSLCGLFDAIRERARALDARVVALDLPSGLDADTGEFDASGLPAEITLTFAAPKRGFQAGGPEGRVRVVSIGTPPAWTA